MGKIYFKNAHVFTGVNESFEALDFLVDDQAGTFVEVGSDVTVAEDVEIVDLAGKYVMPGMINAHTHIILDPLFKIGGLSSVNGNQSEPVVDTYIAVDNLKKLLKNGVTYIRDVGSTYDIDLKLGKLEREGKIVAPGIIGSGAALMMTGGHGAELGREVDGPDETRKAARELLKKGARNIKMMATGGVSIDGEQPTDVQLSVEEMKAAVDEAHHKGRTACAHAQGTQGIKNAIIAGVDSIEHAIYLDDEAIEMLKEHGTFVVPTLVAPWAINQHTDLLPEFMVKKSLEVQEAHFKSIGRAAKAGVKIAMGTDAGTPFNDFEGLNAFELDLMVQAGLTPLQVLQSTTVNAAELLKIAGEAGTIAADKLADFLILERNPLEDIKAVGEEKIVYKKGKQVL
ncbi:metal-dependent hydrolase family protein [Enterococcus italicus]|uniref:metal-dependent hydrolase family protein n=1 Tax=Enterococcus italicus TaxID=246144 RepID=UPI0028AC752B|nr:amidohydrolase family protein [Enterococcus italicus]